MKKKDRNEDYEDNAILEGRPISMSKSITLSSNEKEIAHLAVLMNMAMVEPFLEWVYVMSHFHWFDVLVLATII